MGREHTSKFGVGFVVLRLQGTSLRLTEIKGSAVGDLMQSLFFFVFKPKD